MKICPACDSEFDDAAAVCPHDGTRLVHVDTSVTTERDELVGTMFTDRIRVDNRIGEGGMGAVYKGEDILLGRTVAVKVLHHNLKKSADDVKRFFNEAKVVAKLRHANTIQVFDFGESTTGHYYIAMEYMTGEPLDTYAGKITSLGRVFEIMEQICLSLEEAHSLGIIHRDLKPDNIFIDTVNNRRLVKVIDFGIAKMLSGGENLTQAGMVFGTPAYMSPEQARGDTLDARSDVYSLGVVMFFLLTGQQPFTGANAMEVAVQHITREPPPVADRSRFGALPAALCELTHIMLSKQREDRPQTISDVRRRLLDIARATPEVRIDPSRQTGTMVNVRTERNATTRSDAAGNLVGTTDRLGNEDNDTFPPVRSSRAPMYIGLGAALVVVAAVLVMVVGGSSGGDAEVVDPAPDDGASEVASPAPTEVAEPVDQVEPPVVVEAPPVFGVASAALGQALPAARDASAALVVTLSLDSNPPGATVTRADTGEVIGITPASWSTRRATSQVQLSFALAGYRTGNERASLAASAPVSAVLRADSRAATTEPRSEPSRSEPVATTDDGNSEPTTPRAEEPAASDGGDTASEGGGRPSFLQGGLRDPETISTTP